LRRAHVANHAYDQSGDGWLKADGETIYTAKDLRVGLFQADEAAPASV
jgi:hypothetical protein